MSVTTMNVLFPHFARRSGDAFRFLRSLLAWRGGLLGMIVASALAAGAVRADPVMTNPASPAHAVLGATFSIDFSLSGAQPTMSYSVSNLPPGLTIPEAVMSGSHLKLNAGSGTVSGTPTTAGTYDVALVAWDQANERGNSVSGTFTIVVGSGQASDAPAITGQPADQTANVGDSASFSVDITGVTPLTYQWRKGGVALPGANTATLVIPAVALTDAGNYSVVVTNVVGSATSGNAKLTVNATGTPAITDQPDDQMINVGDSASFSVTATGATPLTYQWRKGGTAITGATGANYVIPVAAAADAGTYSVVVTNSVGSVTSASATLTVSAPATPPVFTTQPAALTVAVGQNAFFAVSASGTQPITWKWLKDGVVIPNETKNTYTVASATLTDAGNIQVVASNAFGTVTSAAARLSVTAAPQAPVISTQPVNISVVTGQTASVWVVATGTGLLTYQWEHDNADVPGGTTAMYTIAAAAPADAGTYFVKVTNSAGTVTSASATLTVTSGSVAPTIITPPANRSAQPGQTVTFTVAANGTAPLTYQWQKNGTAISGATSASYTIASVATTDAATYTVVVSNATGSVTSAAATLTVSQVSTTPTITLQPTNQAVTLGHNVSLDAAASAGTLRWQVSVDAGASWTNLSDGGVYSGTSTGTLTITGATQSLDAHQYRLVATTTNGTAMSNPATLSVIAAFLPAPAAIAVDGAGVIYVADSTADTINEIGPDGAVTILAGAAGTAGTANGVGGNATFNQPGGVAALASGVVFVADTGNSTIRRIAADGTVTTFAGSSSARGNADGAGGAATFSNPHGIAADGAGNLYVADSGNHTIRKITSGGTVSTLAGTAGAQGNADGTGAAARFNSPSGVAVDSAGNVYVADTGNSTIRKISPAGDVITLAGLFGVTGATDGAGTAALFSHPAGVAVDTGGFVYVADTGNSAIRRITPAGVVSTIAGLSTISGLQDGSGNAAFFSQPKALALDSVGNVYVADTGNAALRRVSSGGAVTTLALVAPQPTSNPATGGGSNNGSGGTGGTAPGGGSGGGGGALEAWFVAALALLASARAAIRPRR